jgi:hypothetical protein
MAAPTAWANAHSLAVGIYLWLHVRFITNRKRVDPLTRSRTL